MSCTAEEETKGVMRFKAPIPEAFFYTIFQCEHSKTTSHRYMCPMTLYERLALLHGTLLIDNEGVA